MSLKEAVSVWNSFKKAFCPFTVTWKILFDAVLYKLLFKFSENNRIISKNDIENILCQNFYEELSKCREPLQLDDSLNGLFWKVCPCRRMFGEKESVLERLQKQGQV